jgi:predicted transcriptional regulator YdeE
MEYRIDSLDGFTLIGFSVECKMDDVSGIAPLWEKLIPRINEITGMMGTWGACVANSDPQGFTYIAGCQVAPGATPPAGMASFEIPTHRYIIHPYVGLPVDMSKHWQSVTGELLAASGMEGKFDGPWLEWYPHDCHDAATGNIKCDLYTPVK